MSDRCPSLKYPDAIKKRVDGDWNCPGCNNLNFAFRFECNRCGYVKISEKPFNSVLFITPPKLDVEVDWDEGYINVHP